MKLLSTPGVTGKIISDLFGVVAMGTLGVLSFSIGFWRAGFPNPCFDEDYARWLAASPWQPGLPLPKGTIYPAWRDAAWIVLLTALMFVSTYFTEGLVINLLCMPALLYAAGQAIIRVWASWDPDYRWPFYAVAALPPLLGLLSTTLPLIVLTPLLAVPISLWGVWHRMQKFPWDLLESSNRHTVAACNEYTNSDKRERRIVGWPFQQLRGNVNEFRIAWPIALAEAGLAALWVGGATRLLLLDNTFDNVEESLAMAYLIAGVIGVVLAAIRWVAFLPASCRWWCLGTRAATGRWFFPEYDLPRLTAPLLLLASLTIPMLANLLLSRMSYHSPWAFVLYSCFPAG